MRRTLPLLCVVLATLAMSCERERPDPAAEAARAGLENLVHLLEQEGAACAGEALGVDEGHLVMLFPYDNPERLQAELGFTFPRNAHRSGIEFSENMALLCYFENQEKGVCIQVPRGTMDFSTLAPERVHAMDTCFGVDYVPREGWPPDGLPRVRLAESGEEDR